MDAEVGGVGEWTSGWCERAWGRRWKDVWTQSAGKSCTDLCGLNGFGSKNQLKNGGFEQPSFCKCSREA